MAEISKISAVAIANVAKVDAVTKANIANINDLTIPSAGAFLLDTYTGAALGFSTRRLATATTVLLRVRRDTAGGTGDDDEADVAYDSNDELSLDSAISNASAGVTATTLGQFLNVGTVGGTTYTNPDSLTGTATAFCSKWYDQSTNSNDAFNTTQGKQPKVHNGTVNTDLIQENSKPALSFLTNALILTSDIKSTATDLTAFFVRKNNLNSNHFLFDVPTGRLILDAFLGSFFDGTWRGSKITTTGQILLSYTLLAPTGTVYIDGSSSQTATYSQVALTKGLYEIVIGNERDQSGVDFSGTLQEFVLYTSDESSDRSAIETDINTHFSIF